MSGRGRDSRGRGRGGEARGGDRGRGSRGQGDVRGTAGDRGGRADFGAERGQVRSGGDRGGFVPRGDRGGFIPRGDRGGFVPRGDRGDRGGFVAGRGGGRGRGAPGPVEIFSQPGGIPQPDPKVRSLEDSTLKSSRELSMQSLSLESTMPPRPGFGTQGRSITLYANYFELVAPKSLPLHRYSIEFLPDVQGKKPESKKKLKWLVQLLLQQSLSEYSNSIVTDFANTLISKVDLEVGEGSTYEVQYRAEEEDEPQPGGRIYRIRVQPSGAIQSAELVDYLTSSNMSATCPQKDDIIQALNIMVGHQNKASNSVLFVKPSKYYPFGKTAAETWDLGAGLQALRGYFISVRAATARILLNVQVKHAACYQEGPLDALVRDFQRTYGQNLHRLESFLKMLRIRATHITRRNKAGEEIASRKSVAALASPRDGRDLLHPPIVPRFGASANEVQFHIGNGASGVTREDPGSTTTATAQGGGKGKGGKKGKQSASAPAPTPPAAGASTGYVSVAEYFRKRYRPLEKPDLPVINVGTHQNPSYLPVEVCNVMPGQAFNSKLSPAQTASMIAFAVRRPHQNAVSISTSGGRLVGAGSDSNPPLAAFNISVNPSLITVPGRVLTGPDVEYRGGVPARTRYGSWNMQSVKFSRGSTLPTWSYLWISYQGARDIARDLAGLQPFINRFMRILDASGVNAPAPIPGVQITLTGSPGDEAIIDSIFKAMTNHRARPLLMLVILPPNDKTIYKRVKFLGDIRTGIHTVCVVGSKFAKESRDDNAQYLANVALKFNLKLGGVNHTLKEAKLGIISEGKTMVVGLDVTHPSPGSSENAPSVAGIVASIDNRLSQWPADIRVQTGRQEMISDLCEMFVSRLRLWQEHNRQFLPENILVYRDGVSEGQYDIVMDQELPEIRKACEQTYPATDTKKGLPRLSIIVVGKRHHTRFYPTKANEADERSGNTQNGTVVDRGVTEARNWDFFLQAHSSGLGTARPAHYYIILDEVFRRHFALQKTTRPFEHAADMLEDMTHNMCYLFGRATKAVSICPPAYYADLVCERARCYLSNVFDGSTPAGSVSEFTEATGQGTDQTLQQMREDIKVHERLRDTMFYI